MKISYLSLLAISLLSGASGATLNAMEDEKGVGVKRVISPKKTSIDSDSAKRDNNQPQQSLFSKFQKMDCATFFTHYFKKLVPKKRLEALQIYKKLLEEGASPIQEGNVSSLDNLGKILPEGGFAFPPRLSIQAPFLKYCASGEFKRVLDIGAGSGSDTIPLLLTHNTQVIAVDIYSPQIEQLKQNVSKKLKTAFPELIEKTRFGTLKRNFAEKGSVPPQYENKIDGVNMTRVAHFLNGEEFSTILEHVAAMLKDNGMLSLTVSTTQEGQKEHEWIKFQAKEGLTDPELVYYDTVKTISKDPVQKIFDAMRPGAVELVERKNVDLKSPGTKKEWTADKRAYWEHTLRQGRFYHSLESLNRYMAGKFKIIDSVIFGLGENDTFLSILALRLPRK